jgi:hypothetical protein
MAAGRLIALMSLVAALPALLPAVALADVYKCAGERGAPVYQEMPCPPGKELRNFQTDPPLITILPPQGRPTPAPAAAPKAPATNGKAGVDAKPGKSALAAGDASERKNVRLGMTEAEVLAKLGQPDMTTGGRNGGGARWTYMPAPGDPEMVTSLTFAKGAVTDIERKVVKK